MALVIRMRQQGRKNRQTFRLVVTDKRNPRDGKYVEMLGSYDPHRAQDNLKINTERLSFWLSKGAQISPTAEKLVKKVAPAVIQGIKDQKNAVRVKQAAQRRRLSKKEAPVAKPKKVAKAAAPKVEKKVEAEAAPKKRRTTTKKAKDES